MLPMILALPKFCRDHRPFLTIPNQGTIFYLQFYHKTLLWIKKSKRARLEKLVDKRTGSEVNQKIWNKKRFLEGSILKRFISGTKEEIILINKGVQT